MSATEILTAEEYSAVVEKIIDIMYATIPAEIVRQTVSEWAEQNRVLTQGFCPGPFSFEVTPYLREIVDCLSESSDVREVALMKGSRMGATVGVGENWIGEWIANGRGPFGYGTADAESAGAQMELRIDELINTAGIGHLIGTSEHDRRKGQKTTGDRTTRKRFPGGYILAGGPNAAYFKRAFGLKGFYGDEIDADAWEMAMKDGDKVFLIRRRLSEFEDSYKALWTSSPKLAGTSNIMRVYKEGDQRKYFVPCKHCGHMQFLRWGEKDNPGGLKFDHTDDDRLVDGSVRYECAECGGTWTNSDKDWFLQRGEWRPTATARRPGMRSYHLPTLYSPVGAVSWDSGVIDFLQIKHENFPPLKFQVWVNTYLGEPFEEKGEAPRIDNLVLREKGYGAGELPDDAKPLIVTIGADVQADRIECEIVAWGRDAESWSINYHVIPGDTADIESEAWDAMRSVIEQKHAGIQAAFVGIDAGYRTDVVYDFCDAYSGQVFPVMGSEQTAKSQSIVRFATIKGRSKIRVDVDTNIIKQEVYRYLKFGIPESGTIPRGYCHFPRDYTRDHFNRLIAERRVPRRLPNGAVKYVWDAGERRNEQLDCRVYALAMVYSYFEAVNEDAQKDGSVEKGEKITWEMFWNYLERQKLGLV